MVDQNRRDALKALGAATAAVTAAGSPMARSLGGMLQSEKAEKPNVLFIMTDQQRFDTIAALGNEIIYTPNLDRLANRGISFTNAYSPCPECVPARYCYRTGCESPITGFYANAWEPTLRPGQALQMTDRCGPYLAQAMTNLGYRTFGIGKFHTVPWNESVGFDVQLHSEEWYVDAEQRSGDAYASWIATKHQPFNFIEQLMGERSEMFYMPQMSPLSADLTVEGWAAAQAVDQIALHDERPFFGLVSFIGPHPPISPPIPFNRLYDPDRMPNPVVGKLDTDFMDAEIPWMNYGVWAENINEEHARIIKARYYGEITYIDACIGKILDAVERRKNASNTLICFFADHGDHLGDHHAWQKESFFEPSCRVPFLVSWPSRIESKRIRNDLVCLTDLFGIATGAAGRPELRQGYDILGYKTGNPVKRSKLVTYYGVPGTRQFKVMVRYEKWKYIFIANGGKEQLFDLERDPYELVNLVEVRANIRKDLHHMAVESCRASQLESVLHGDSILGLPFDATSKVRFVQMDWSRGIKTFPKDRAGIAETIEKWKV